MNDFYQYSKSDKFYGRAKGMTPGEDGWIEFAFGGTYMPNPKWGGSVPVFVAKDQNSKPPKDVLLPNGDILTTDGHIILKSSGKVAVIMSFLATNEVPMSPVETSDPVPAKYNNVSEIKFPVISGEMTLLENGDIVYKDGSKFQRAYSWIVAKDGSQTFDIDKVNQANKIYPVHFGGAVTETAPEGNATDYSSQSNGSEGTSDTKKGKTGLWVFLGIGALVAGVVGYKVTSKKRKSKS